MTCTPGMHISGKPPRGTTSRDGVTCDQRGEGRGGMIAGQGWRRYPHRCTLVTAIAASFKNYHLVFPYFKTAQRFLAVHVKVFIFWLPKAKYHHNTDTISEF